MVPFAKRREEIMSDERESAGGAVLIKDNTIEVPEDAKHNPLCIWDDHGIVLTISKTGKIRVTDQSRLEIWAAQTWKNMEALNDMPISDEDVDA